MSAQMDTACGAIADMAVASNDFDRIPWYCTVRDLRDALLFDFWSGGPTTWLVFSEYGALARAEAVETFLRPLVYLDRPLGTSP